MKNKRYFTDQDISSLRQRYRVEETIDQALTRKLIRRRGPDYKLPELEALASRLTTFISTQLDSPFHITDLVRVPGGGSKEMFSFILHRPADEETSEQKLILRMDPGESIAETHRLREFQVMQAMKGIVPVPDVFWVDPDGECLGSAGMICGFVSGVVKPSVPQSAGGKVSGIGAGFPTESRAPLFRQFLDYLLAIHDFDWRGANLSALEEPQSGITEAAALALSHWSRVWDEDCFAEHPMITLTAGWLRDNLPVSESVCLVHNDYRNGNFLYDERTLEITAILDWELARLGDYHEDLAWILFPGFASPDENGDPLVCGLAARETFVELYREKSGRPVNEDTLRFYTILNLYKLAILGFATNARAAADRQSHLEVMMNISTGLGCSALNGLYQMLVIEGGLS